MKQQVPALQYCPSLLTEGFDTYSPPARRNLFFGKKVSHILPYDAPWKTDSDTNAFMANAKRISLSGVQEKYSLIQVKNRLRLTEEGEQGTHILKPTPAQLKRSDDVPANEQLTMLIAAQVFQIQTAASGLIFFENGEPAYITRRFDLKKDGTKKGKEDFASLAGKTSANAGADFKYDSSYEAMGALLKKYVPAYKIEVEKFFSLIIFNYLFSNGDAHLKNFALLETEYGDHQLSPAYDLVNTRLHIDDADFGLRKGLFEDEYKSTAFRQYGHAAKEDFLELSRRLEMDQKRTARLIALFGQHQPLVDELVKRSFLRQRAKELYLSHYQTRLKSFNA
ncbi:MAG: phosphatidylinositol kinase [Citrobacter freundii]|nr:MAG: phosphatidylinositol kinase [Citrobacter freundii]